MGRPQKNNADYFSHDAAMRNDIKIKALRRRFQHKGYAVWCFILETLTSANDLEITFDEMNKELLAADYGISVEELDEIVNYCVKINLLQIEDNKLFSRAHKNRLDVLFQKRKRERERVSAILLRQKLPKNGVIAAETTEKDSFQSVKPYSKVKESKVKKTKEKDISNDISKKKKYPYQDIPRLWNEICVSLPKVARLNDRRKQKIKSRLDEFTPDPSDWLAFTENLFRRVQSSDFLTGRTGNNRNNWTATFDWLFDNGTNWVKVSEGNYDNKRGRQQNTEPRLGVGEYIDPQTGRRTYGTGKATIPDTADPRPSERHQWDAQSESWIML